VTLTKTEEGRRGRKEGRSIVIIARWGRCLGAFAFKGEKEKDGIFGAKARADYNDQKEGEQEHWDNEQPPAKNIPGEIEEEKGEKTGGGSAQNVLLG